MYDTMAKARAVWIPTRAKILHDGDTSVLYIHNGLLMLDCQQRQYKPFATQEEMTL